MKVMFDLTGTEDGRYNLGLITMNSMFILRRMSEEEIRKLLEGIGNELSLLEAAKG